MPNITTNHAITYTNTIMSHHCFLSSGNAKGTFYYNSVGQFDFLRKELSYCIRFLTFFAIKAEKKMSYYQNSAPFFRVRVSKRH